MKLLIATAIALLVSSCHPGTNDSAYGKKRSFVQPQLIKQIDSLFSGFNRITHGYVGVQVDKGNDFIGIDSLTGILKMIQDADMPNESTYDVYEKSQQHFQILTWRTKVSYSDIIVLTQFNFDTTFYKTNSKGHREYINEIKITDFELQKRSQPKFILLRIINDKYFKLLFLDTMDYKPIYPAKVIISRVYNPSEEEKLFGLDEADSTYEKKKKVYR